jgi:hypothetical protein
MASVYEIVRSFVQNIVKNPLKTGILTYLILKMLQPEMKEGFAEGVKIIAKKDGRELVMDTETREWAIIDGDRIVWFDSEGEARGSFDRSRFSSCMKEEEKMSERVEALSRRFHESKITFSDKDKARSALKELEKGGIQVWLYPEAPLEVRVRDQDSEAAKSILIKKYGNEFLSMEKLKEEVPTMNPEQNTRYSPELGKYAMDLFSKGCQRAEVARKMKLHTKFSIGKEQLEAAMDDAEKMNAEKCKEEFRLKKGDKVKTATQDGTIVDIRFNDKDELQDLTVRLDDGKVVSVPESEVEKLREAVRSVHSRIERLKEQFKAGKIDGGQLADRANGLAASYGRGEISQDEFEKKHKFLLESFYVDGWFGKNTSDGTKYIKNHGVEKWYIVVKNSKIISSTKTIDGEEFPLNQSVVDDFKKKLSDQTGIRIEMAGMKESVSEGKHWSGRDFKDLKKIKIISSPEFQGRLDGKIGFLVDDGDWRQATVYFDNPKSSASLNLRRNEVKILESLSESVKNELKTFDVSTEKGIADSEKYQALMYKKYPIVKVAASGIDKISIWGELKESLSYRLKTLKESFKESLADDYIHQMRKAPKEDLMGWMDDAKESRMKGMLSSDELKRIEKEYETLRVRKEALPKPHSDEATGWIVVDMNTGKEKTALPATFDQARKYRDELKRKMPEGDYKVVNVVSRKSESLSETIKHEGGKWKVYSKDGSKLLGTHDTEEEAQKQLAAIEISKHSETLSSRLVRMKESLKEASFIVNEKCEKCDNGYVVGYIVKQENGAFSSEVSVWKKDKETEKKIQPPIYEKKYSGNDAGEKAFEDYARQKGKYGGRFQRWTPYRGGYHAESLSSRITRMQENLIKKNHR